MSGVRLVCPRSRRLLEPRVVAGQRALVSDDGFWAYRVQGNVPILLAPEALAGPSADPPDGRYDEAYDEMQYYDALARRCAAELRRAMEVRTDSDPLRASDDAVGEGVRLAAFAATARLLRFPDPPSAWVHLRYEAAALHDAYAHLAPLEGKRVLQVGGMGLDAVKFLLAGAQHAWLVGPMAGELEFAAVLADVCGVGHRLSLVRAIAEELPFADGAFDAVFAGGTVHHTITTLSLPECARVLANGGRFAAVEPWRSAGYALGITLLGKREPVHCQPLDRDRTAPLFAAFDDATVIHHGALTRYPLVALARLGAKLPMRAVRLLTRVDDLICRCIRLKGVGSSVALLGTTGSP
jgi:SAM-dependent methyltransferase